MSVLKTNVRRWPALGWAVVLACLLSACGDRSSHSSSGQPTREFGSNVVAYPVRGVLEEIRAGGTKAVIAHEDIPGYMEAMSMLLEVRGTNKLSGLQPGDQITFRMLVTDTDGWIDQVKKIGTVTLPLRTNTVAAADELAELVPGDPLPDCTLTNQFGQAIRLSDFRGRALAFTFIFTRCPFPVYCPRLNQHFSAVQSALTQAAATNSTSTNWHLLCISFDPEFDTSERLAQYAKTHRQDPARWTFATGRTEDIRRLGSGFTLAFWKEGAIFNHNVRTVVVDPKGRIQRVFTDTEWQPAELIDEMKKAMQR